MSLQAFLITAVPVATGDSSREAGWTVCACPDAETAAKTVALLNIRIAAMRAVQKSQDQKISAWLVANPPIPPGGTLQESAHRRTAREAWRASFAEATENAWAVAIGRPLNPFDKMTIDLIDEGWRLVAEEAPVPWIADP